MLNIPVNCEVHLIIEKRINKGENNVDMFFVGVANGDARTEWWEVSNADFDSATPGESYLYIVGFPVETEVVVDKFMHEAALGIFKDDALPLTDDECAVLPDHAANDVYEEVVEDSCERIDYGVAR